MGLFAVSLLRLCSIQYLVCCLIKDLMIRIASSSCPREGKKVMCSLDQISTPPLGEGPSTFAIFSVLSPRSLTLPLSPWIYPNPRHILPLEAWSS
uniref:Secreted protein n=1 Tax=Populus trichocarpa TaxID=3694 RepID=A0A2K1YHJ3_POPTR